MRMGDTLVINVDKTMPNFESDYKSNDFPTDLIFDFEYWHETKPQKNIETRRKYRFIRE